MQPILVFFSSSLLYDIAGMELVSEKIDRLTQNSFVRCRDSDFVHTRINEQLVSSLVFI